MYEINKFSFISHYQLSTTISVVVFQSVRLYYLRQCIVAFQYKDDAWVCDNIKNTDEYEILTLNVYGMTGCGLIEFFDRLEHTILQAKRRLFQDLSDDEVISEYLSRASNQMQRAA